MTIHNKNNSWTHPLSHHNLNSHPNKHTPSHRTPYHHRPVSSSRQRSLHANYAGKRDPPRPRQKSLARDSSVYEDTSGPGTRRARSRPGARAVSSNKAARRGRSAEIPKMSPAADFARKELATRGGLLSVIIRSSRAECRAGWGGRAFTGPRLQIETVWFVAGRGPKVGTSIETIRFRPRAPGSPGREIGFWQKWQFRALPAARSDPGWMARLYELRRVTRWKLSSNIDAVLY